jgi:hypothetical protein
MADDAEGWLKKNAEEPEVVLLNHNLKIVSLIIDRDLNRTKLNKLQITGNGWWSR